MSNNTDSRYSRHNRRKYSLKVHIILVTKYRKQLLCGTIDEDVKHKILDTCEVYGWDIIAMETDKDHIHFLIGYDTTDSVCDIVKIIKQTTAYHLGRNIRSSCHGSTGKRKSSGRTAILSAA